MFKSLGHLETFSIVNYLEERALLQPQWIAQFCHSFSRKRPFKRYHQADYSESLDSYGIFIAPSIKGNFHVFSEHCS